MEIDERVITITDRQGKPRKITLKKYGNLCCKNCSIWKLENGCGKFPPPEKKHPGSLLDWCINLIRYGDKYLPKDLYKEYPELFLKYRRPWKR